MIFTTGGTLKWAASPCKAIFTILIYAAAGGSLRTAIIIIANSRGLYWGWGRWTWIRRIWPVLYRVRGLNCNSTFTRRTASQIPFHSNIPVLPPVFAPRVSNNPVVMTIFCAISHSSNTMVQGCPTFASKYTLRNSSNRGEHTAKGGIGYGILQMLNQ